MIKLYFKILASLFLFIFVIFITFAPIVVPAILTVSYDQSPYWWFLCTAYIFEFPLWVIAGTIAAEEDQEGYFK